jgi:hypothetical protein
LRLRISVNYKHAHSRSEAALPGGEAAAVGQVGGRDPGPQEGGAGVARHLRHGGGRRYRLRRGGAAVQGHQGQAQLPGARPGPNRPRLPRHPRHPGPPAPVGGGDPGSNAAAAPPARPPDRRAVPRPHAVRAAAAGRPGRRPRRGGGPAGAPSAAAAHDDDGRPAGSQPALHVLAVVVLVGAADTGLLHAAAHPARPAVPVAAVGRCGAVHAVVHDHRVVAQRRCMAVRRGAPQE